MVAYTYNPSFSGGRHRRIVSLGPAWAKLARPFCFVSKTKGLGDRTQVVEHLPSRCKALSLIPTIAKEKKMTKR
jgi:hypothetical protein